MIIYDILLILQYQVSTTVMDLVVVFVLFVLLTLFTVLALLYFCVATVFSANKDLYCTKLPATFWITSCEAISDVHHLPR